MAGPELYQDLPNPRDSIRLLSIDPGWPTDPITLHLTVVPDRKEAPQYQALSYVWGSTLNPTIVRCNDIEVPITNNLASALRALRPLPSHGDPTDNGIVPMDESHMLHSSKQVWNGIARNRTEVAELQLRRARPGNEHQYFWIDALCINQADVAERTEQVKGMRHIYTMATMVRIWLGDELVAPDGSPLDLPAMTTSKIDRMLGRIRLAELGHMPVVLSFLVQALRNAHLVNRDREDALGGPELDEVGFPRRQSEEYLILGAFLNQPWFHRMWIVQEAVLAQESNITIGDWELDWKPFAEAVVILNMSSVSSTYSLQLKFTGVTTGETASRLDLQTALYLSDIQHLKNRTKFLFPLLSDSRRRKATNPADHVFGVLGMAEEMQNPAFMAKLPVDPETLLNPDYTKPVGNVFRDATWFIIAAHNTLRPLLMAEVTEPNPVEGCPSWVPIWSQERQTMRLYHELFHADAKQPLSLKDLDG